MNTRDTFEKAAYDAAQAAAMACLDLGGITAGQVNMAFKEGWDSRLNAYVGGPRPYGHTEPLARLWQAGRRAGLSYGLNPSIQNLVGEI